MKRRTLLRAGVTAVPAALIAVSAELGHQYSDRKIVIDQNVHDDKRTHEALLTWARANGLDPMHWGMPVTINIDQTTITGPYYPEQDAPFNYERTVPMPVPLPKILIGD